MSVMMTGMDRREIGRRVLDRRLQLGYTTQREVAQVAGVGTTTWGNLERGKELPKTRRIQAQVSRALQWPADAFRKMEEGKEPDAPTENGGAPASSPIDGLAAEVARVREDQGRLSRQMDQIAQDVRRLLETTSR